MRLWQKSGVKITEGLFGNVKFQLIIDKDRFGYSLRIYGASSVGEVSDTLISVNVGSISVNVRGDRLVLSTLEGGGVMVCGKVNAVELP